MKRIIIEQEESVSINDIDRESNFIVVKTKDGDILNYTEQGDLTHLLGGEPYTKHLFIELIEQRCEAYEFTSEIKFKNWIKDNL
jgi:hypothetical protein